MRRVVAGLVALVAAAPLAGLACIPARAVVDVPTLITADRETVPVAHTGDAADDPAIWVDPTDPASSLVIGNDKGGALETYNLDGSLHQRLTSSTTFWGNVDVRQQVTVGAQTLDVVAAANGGLRLFRVDAATRQLLPVTDGKIANSAGEGICLYHSEVTGDLSAFVIQRTGELHQLRIQDSDGDGLLDATLVRSFQIGSEAEGCVADDATGALYVSQEDVALWRYGAEPTDGTSRTMIDQVQPSGFLSADIEGVTLVDLVGDAGYVIASAQDEADPNHSYFTVYDRQTGAYVKSFRIATGPTADGCERTDGVTAYAGDLGPSFPFGLFVCQDNNNTAPGVGNQDFKLVALEKVVDLNPDPGDELPIPSFTATCTYLECSFDGTGSTDPDGTIAGYSWTFGDGTTGRGPTITHTYATSGPRTVTLTTLDNDYASASTSQQVEPTSGPGTGALTYVGAASINNNSAAHKVVVPAAVQPGDAMLLSFAGNRSDTTITGPPGWTLLQSVDANGAVGLLWERVAIAGDAGASATVKSSASMKADLTVSAYRGTAAEPVAASAARADSAALTNHTTPTVTVNDGDWLLSYWADKSAAATTWTLPAGAVRRSATTGSAAGHITAALADSDAGLPAGQAGGLTATTGVKSSKAIMFTVALAPG